MATKPVSEFTDAVVRHAERLEWQPSPFTADALNEAPERMNAALDRIAAIFERARLRGAVLVADREWRKRNWGK